MIEGLKLKVTSAELKTHCSSRSSYHSTRANEKADKLPEIRKSLETIRGSAATTMSMMSKGGYHLDPDDPVKDLERDIEDHRNKSLVFGFFAEHLFDEDYTLREDDLVRLEILKR